MGRTAGGEGEACEGDEWPSWSELAGRAWSQTRTIQPLTPLNRSVVPVLWAATAGTVVGVR